MKRKSTTRGIMVRGFTLIEILVVIAISAILAAVAIGYNHQMQDQVALSVDTAKISQLILTAKNLAISSATITPGTCGYGVYIDRANSTYSLFAYQPSAATYGALQTCPSYNDIGRHGIAQSEIAAYSQGTYNIPLSAGVKFASSGSGNDLVLVLFYPPAPKIFLSRDTNSVHAIYNQTSEIDIETVDGKTSNAIFVTPAGQVDNGSSGVGQWAAPTPFPSPTPAPTPTPTPTPAPTPTPIVNPFPATPTLYVPPS